MNKLLTNPSETVFELGISTGKKLGDVAMKQAQVTMQAAASQITGQQPSASKPSSSELKMPVPHVPTETKDVVRDFYAPSKGNEIIDEMKPEHKQAMISQQKAKDEHDIAATRQKMQAHFQQNMQQYWKPTFEEHPKIEEQKEEQEKRQEEAEEQQMKELKQQEKKKEDVALRRAQTSAENKMGTLG